MEMEGDVREISMKFTNGHTINSGRTPWNKGTKGVVKGFWTGKKRSTEDIEKFRKSHLGKVGPWRGKKRPNITGKKAPNWKGGITKINAAIRSSVEYRLWRKAVFERDGYTCVWCLKKGVRLNADHIKPFSLYPELRLAIDNGRTLCEECHKTTETFKGRMRRWQKPH